jgi:asparagine synthase (glutamine-hydrolysing)
MPFLDHRLVEFVWPLPGEYKVHLGVGKYLHRSAMRGLVDDAILDERAKYGFTTPIGQQFRKLFPPGAGPVDVLLSERCLGRGLFDRAALLRIVRVHQAGEADHGPLLFRLLSVELWFRTFVDEEGRPPNAAPRTDAESAAMALA